MWRFILDDLARPIAHRVGSYVGTTLTTLGVAADDIQIVVAAIPVIVGIAFDLVIRRLL
jgi:hypothetical protein